MLSKTSKKIAHIRDDETNKKFDFDKKESHNTHSLPSVCGKREQGCKGKVSFTRLFWKNAFFRQPPFDSLETDLCFSLNLILLKKHAKKIN